MSFYLIIQAHEIGLLLPGGHGVFLPTEANTAGRLAEALREATGVEEKHVPTVASNTHRIITWAQHTRARAGLPGGSEDRISVFANREITDLTFHTSFHPLPGNLLLNIRDGDTVSGAGRWILAHRNSNGVSQHHTSVLPLAPGETSTDRLTDAGLGDWAASLEELDEILVTIRDVHDRLCA